MPPDGATQRAVRTPPKDRLLTENSVNKLWSVPNERSLSHEA